MFWNFWKRVSAVEGEIATIAELSGLSAILNNCSLSTQSIAMDSDGLRKEG